MTRPFFSLISCLRPTFFISVSVCCCKIFYKTSFNEDWLREKFVLLDRDVVAFLSKDFGVLGVRKLKILTIPLYNSF